MKHLLLFLLCQISLDGFGQTKIDTLHIGHLKLIFRNDTLFKEISIGAAIEGNNKPDTIPSWILLSAGRIQSFGHAIEGYCIYQGDACSGRHLKYWHKRFIAIGPQYVVWGCRRRGKK